MKWPPGWSQRVERVTAALKRLEAKLKRKSGKAFDESRGPFKAFTTGFSFGGGQEVRASSRLKPTY